MEIIAPTIVLIKKISELCAFHFKEKGDEEVREKYEEEGRLLLEVD